MIFLRIFTDVIEYLVDLIVRGVLCENFVLLGNQSEIKLVDRNRVA